MTGETVSTLKSINPATGNLIQEYELMSDQKITRVLERSADAFSGWHRSRFAHRAGLLKETAKILRRRLEELSGLITREMGKPVRQSRAEVEKCAWLCDYYAREGERFLRPEPVDSDARESKVTFQPLGPVLGIMPWNFPFWQVFRFAVPAVMAGNTGLLKHASNVPGCALAVEDVFEEAGFPAGVFQTLLATSGQALSALEDARIRAVSLTGSVPAGKKVAGKAGSLVKKSVMELGGSDAYLILEDADLAKTAAVCAAARLINSGQSCIAAKRFIVAGGAAERFTELLSMEMRKRKIGDPFKTHTDIGPLARDDLRRELQDQVDRSVAQGARVAYRAEGIPEKGFYFPPLVLDQVAPGMPAFDEELFGPVAAVIAAGSQKQAVKLANTTSFGLGAAVFTTDLERGLHIAEHDLEAGGCFVNTHVRSDPRLPFGGIRESGYGRELGRFGIREFVNIKTVYLA
jgi:succinate-semialdehyde dehydrogenase/glutarate-semialdehyde dehydrogenase